MIVLAVGRVPRGVRVWSRIAAVLLPLVLAVFLLVVGQQRAFGMPASPSTLSSASRSPAQGLRYLCSGQAQPPVGQSGIVRANGFQSCTNGGDWRPQRVVVQIQRLRWFGWQTVATEDSGYVLDPFVERTAFYKCLGTGRYTYRTLATGYVANGAGRSGPLASAITLDYLC